MTLARFTARKLSQAETDVLVAAVLEDFSKVVGLRAIVLFGSAVSGEMTTESDLDLILILNTKEDMQKARKQVPLMRNRSTWPMDLLFVDADTFRKKSRVGGVYFVARSEGKVVLGELP